MANNEVKQRIKLEGEKEYRQALSEATRHLKTLRSELKAETAELGKNATEQQKAEVRAKSLQKQITEQEKIVKTYTKALAEVREKYGDNEEEISKWEIKLNDARATLAGMRDGLESVGQGFQKVSADANTGVTAAQSFAQAFGGLSGIGESISGAVESIFEGMINTARQAVGELWQLTTETAAKANRWTDLASYYGSTAEQMQLMDRSIAEVAGDFGKFTNLVNQLSFGGKNDKITEWFGVSDANYKNNIDYTMAVLDAMQKAYNKWGTGGKWDNAMADIFGAKKSADVSWFVTNLDGIKKKRDELTKNGGFLMDEKELSTMNEVHIELNTIEDRWDALKGKFASGFGKVTLDIMTNVEGGLDAIAKYFDAETDEEREEALAELEKNITSAFERIGKALRDGVAILEKVAEDLKESKDPVVQGIGNVLGGLVDALKWFTEENANNVVKALEIIAGFWLAGKGLSMGAKIAEIAGNIKTIQLYNALGGATTGAETAGATAGTTAGVTAGMTAGGGGWLTNLLGLAGLGMIANGFAWAAKERNTNEEIRGSDKSVVAAAGGDDALFSAFLRYAGANKELADYYNGTDYNADREGELYEALNAAAEELHSFSDYQKILDAWSDWQQENSRGSNYWEVPADWWKSGSGEDGVTSQDIQNLDRMPEAVKGAVAALIGSIRIDLDGNKVADLLTPRVSERVARELED